MELLCSEKQSYKYKWRYTEEERAPDSYCRCYDCGMPYGEFPDMVIPNDLWELITPSPHKEGGLLCPTCIANRLDYLDKWYEGDLFVLRTKHVTRNPEVGK